MKKSLHILFLVISFLLLLGSLFQIAGDTFSGNDNDIPHPRDNFDPSLLRLDNLDKLEQFVDSIAAIKNINPIKDPQYVYIADSIVRLRFYYGLQNYKFSENYIANILGKYVWSHLGAKVIPDDILLGQKAFCSQSSIVFQELLKNKGYDVRSVFLTGHFCTEVLINGNWQFHDVSYKPDNQRIRNLSTADLINQPNLLREAYLFSFAENFQENLAEHFNPYQISYGAINVFAAKNMLLVHKIMGFLSNWGWLVMSIITIIYGRVFKLKGI